MMKIDRSNYEIVIIDWLDGSLNDLESTQLFQFLGENPDLKEEFMEIELLRLTPQESQISDKAKLRKSAADLSETQFEYLCAAFLENDLSAEQRTELLQMTADDPVKKKTLEQISRTRLTPPDILFPDKKLLLKRTVFQNAIRLSAIILSAAAVITLAFILYFTQPRELPGNIESNAQAIVSDSISKSNFDQNIPENEPAVIPAQSSKRTNTIALNQHSPKTAMPSSAEKQTITAEPAITRTEIVIEKINVLPDVGLKSEVPDNLIALSYTETSEPVDDSRSKFGKLIAKTFREKFLKDKTPADSPLKGYEIAKAGVAGLNKLLGWEMALNERKDTEGNLRSVYFSSKMLKFNAPVKNTEALR
jgi:hypothetical protein